MEAKGQAEKHSDGPEVKMERVNGRMVPAEAAKARPEDSVALSEQQQATKDRARLATPPTAPDPVKRVNTGRTSSIPEDPAQSDNEEPDQSKDEKHDEEHNEEHEEEHDEHAGRNPFENEVGFVSYTEPVELFGNSSLPNDGRSPQLWKAVQRRKAPVGLHRKLFNICNGDELTTDPVNKCRRLFNTWPKEFWGDFLNFADEEGDTSFHMACYWGYRLSLDEMHTRCLSCDAFANSMFTANSVSVGMDTRCVAGCLLCAS